MWINTSYVMLNYSFLKNWSRLNLKAKRKHHHLLNSIFITLSNIRKSDTSAQYFEKQNMKIFTWYFFTTHSYPYNCFLYKKGLQSPTEQWPLCINWKKYHINSHITKTFVWISLVKVLSCFLKHYKLRVRSRASEK